MKYTIEELNEMMKQIPNTDPKQLVGDIISDAKKGKGYEHSQETKDHMSVIKKGTTRIFSESHLQHIRESAKKRPPKSEETKEKIRQSMLKRWNALT